MSFASFQQWLYNHGASLAADGKPGPATRAAIWSLFQNRKAAAITTDDLTRFANRLGCTVRQLQAVATVESNGGGFLNSGHPKILWERHYFWKRMAVKLASGSVSGAWLAHPTGGGYTIDADNDGLNDSWEKLVEGAMRNPQAAFESCSWGKFQIMGAWWQKLGYANPFNFAYSMVESEAGHYEALCRYIEVNGLKPAIQALSASPQTCVAFARGYNGPGYAKGEYHIKLARAMR